MNNLLQDCSPPSYVSADDKYLWLSYKPFFRKAWIEMLPEVHSSEPGGQEQGLMFTVHPLLRSRVGSGVGRPGNSKPKYLDQNNMLGKTHRS